MQNDIRYSASIKVKKSSSAPNSPDGSGTEAGLCGEGTANSRIQMFDKD